jgi:ribosomal protein S18 acetylase RimI-like enzyme
MSLKECSEVVVRRVGLNRMDDLLALEEACFQSDRIGRRLLARAEQEALRRGCCRIRLEVRMENVFAIRLYERLGFSDSAVLPGYYEDGAHAFVMRKELI